MNVDYIDFYKRDTECSAILMGANVPTKMAMRFITIK